MIKVIGIVGAVAPVKMMMRRPRRNHCAPFKAKIALVGLRGDKTLVELSEQFDGHANQIVPWQQQAVENLAAASTRERQPKTCEAER